MVGIPIATRCAPPLLVAALALALAGCPKNVPQDKATGEDGRYKGAKPVALEPGAPGPAGEVHLTGEARGIVTYPGGDRVDWKLIELPEGKRGTLELALAWRAPRPGLDLSLDVYNEWGTRLDSAGPRRQRRDRGKKSVTIADARGKVYVEVYASGRGDAGKYELEVAFAEQPIVVVEVFDPTRLDVPDPPKLAAIPEACTAQNFDKTNPDCQKHPPPCDANNFHKDNPNCPEVCPNPPDPQWPACKKGSEPPPEPESEPEPPPIIEHLGKVTDVQISGDLSVITIHVGEKHPVERGWTGQVLDDRGRPIKGSDFVVKTTRSRQVTATVKLKRDTVEGRQVILRAP
jgi:hypothetical protein